MSYSKPLKIKGQLSRATALSCLGCWAAIPTEPSQPQSVCFSKKISNSKLCVSHNKHRKTIILFLKLPHDGEGKKDKAEFPSMGDPVGGTHNVILDDVGTGLLVTLSGGRFILSTSAPALFQPRGNFPDGVLPSLMPAYLPVVHRLKALCRKWYSTPIE